MQFYEMTHSIPLNIVEYTAYGFSLRCCGLILQVKH